jgi:hypothetical protein
MGVVKGAISEAGRIRLSALERPGEVIASALVLSAGDESTAWLGGFRRGVGAARADPRESDPVRRRVDANIGPSHAGVSCPPHPAQLLPFGARQTIVRSASRLRKSVLHRTGK